MAGNIDIAVFGMLYNLNSNACVSKCYKADQEHSRSTENFNYSILMDSNKFTSMITSKLLLSKDAYSHRMWPQHKTGQILHFRAQLVLLSFLCLFPLRFCFRISASHPHKWQMCVERLFTRDSFYARIFWTWPAQQQTGVHWLCLFPPHKHTHLIHTLKCRVCLCLSVGEVRGPKGTNSRSALWGQRGAVGLLESRRGILCETETSRLTETPHSCTTTAPLTSCTGRCLKPAFCVFKPIFLCCQSRALPPAESTCSSGHRRQQGTDSNLLRQYLQTSSLFFYR